MATYTLDNTDNSQNGTAAADVFTGGEGNDTLSGLAGNDMFKETDSDGSDSIDGGDGVDTVTYKDTVSNTPITFIVGTGSVERNTDTDTLTSIEKVIATTATNDSLDGSSDTDGFTFDMTKGTVTGLAGLVSATLFENAAGGDGNDTILDTKGTNTILGGLGNDTISGSGGADSMDGGDGTDTLQFKASVVYFTDSSGTDQYGLLSGNSYYMGPQDANFEVLAASSSKTDQFNASGEAGALTIDLSTGDVSGFAASTISSISGFEQVLGGHVEDTITGNASANVLWGLDGNDTISGGAGNDTIEGGTGDNSIDGGDGVDKIDSVGDFGNGQTTYTYDGSTTTMTHDGSSTDTLVSIEQVVGTSGFTDVLDLSGDTDGVTVNLTTGVVSGAMNGLVLATGFEDFTGGDGVDTVTGSLADNIINTGDGNDVITYSTGNDSIDGGGGSDTLTYATLGTTMTYHLDAGTVTFGTTTQHIDNIEIMVGGKGKVDVLDASGILTNISLDMTAGTASNLGDLTTVTGFENVIGGDADDTISGTAGSNIMSGGTGHNTISGLGGNDTFNALLSEITSHDTTNTNFVGGDGVDTFNLGSISASDVQNEQILSLFDIGSMSVTAQSDSEGTGSVYNLASIEKIVGTVGGNDAISAYSSGISQGVNINLVTGTIVIGTTTQTYKATGFEHATGGMGNDTLTGTTGNNALDGATGNDHVIGGSGNDTLSNPGGDDTLDGGAGNDQYLVYSSSTSADTIIDSAGTDTLVISNSTNIDSTINLTASTGDEVTYGTHTMNWTGNIIENVILVDYMGNDSVTGSSGNNLLDTGYGNDTVDGGAGNDTIGCSTGDDLLKGGIGNDTYYAYNNASINSLYGTDNSLIGHDVVQDYSGTTSGGTADVMLFNLNVGDVTFSAVDSNSDTFYDQLVVSINGGNDLTIDKYFDNSTASVGSLHAGIGCIESMHFLDDSSVDFTQVLTLL